MNTQRFSALSVLMATLLAPLASAAADSAAEQRCLAGLARLLTADGQQYELGAARSGMLTPQHQGKMSPHVQTVLSGEWHEEDDNASDCRKAAGAKSKEHRINGGDDAEDVRNKMEHDLDLSRAGDEDEEHVLRQHKLRDRGLDAEALVDDRQGSDDHRNARREWDVGGQQRHQLDREMAALTPSVPEPATYATLLGGLALLAAVRRRVNAGKALPVVRR